MMVGGGVDEEDPRPVDEWPPPADPHQDLSNKDGTSSRLLFLTVQYVEGEPTASFNTGLESFSELDQRVVSPLDPNMGCTACYSPVYRPASPLMPAPVSPSAGYLTANSPSPPETEGMIVLSEPITGQLGGPDNFVVTSGSRLFGQEQVPDDGKLLLLSTEPSQPTELVVAAEACGEQRVELLLSNGTIAYGIVGSADANGTRVIQIPREYLVAARPQNTDLPTEDTGHNENIQEENVQDDNGHLRALYNTLKEQGLIIEPGELRLEPDLDQNQQLMDQSLELPVLQPISEPQTIYSQLPQSETLQPVQKRFWCGECNVLLDSDCTEHQINRKISDKAVPSRARATLPASYLAINRLPDSDKGEYGVFARKTIPKRTQFGPIEGVLIKSEDVMLVREGPYLELTIELDTGEFKTLDVSNEHMSNWMRFVRMASTERPPNLLLSQLGDSLYFTSTQMIHQREELLVWYSPSYAQRRSLPTDPPQIEWPCSTCGKKLKSADELAQHSSCHKPAKKEENLTINTLKRKNQAMVTFVKKDIAERNTQNRLKYECAICNKRFPRVFSLKRHILLLHTRENKYHCKICHLGFSHSYNRLRHMRRVHPNHKDNKPVKNVINRYVSWSCSHCKLTFSSASILNLHTLVHAANNIEENNTNLPDDIQDVLQKKEELISCPQCSQKFNCKRKLASHVTEHGKDRGVTDRKKLHCDVCGRNFTSSVRFQIHKELHGDDSNKPLQCNICFRRFINRSALTGHLKIHNAGNIQWECPICKEQFGNVLALRNHVHTHAVDRVYYCPHCDKGFDEYSGIRKHIRAFHSVRKYICVDCGKCFHTQDKLRIHLLRHSDHREFLCANCGKQFKRKDKLQEHMKRMHSSDKEKTSEKSVQEKKVLSKIMMNSSDYERYIYKCHSCVLGFKRRGMLVNHLANRHPDITPDSVPELNLPILKTTRDYYCQYCDKIYKSSSKRKAHILKNHPGLDLPMSNRQKGGVPEIPGLPNPTFSQTVGSITTNPHSCQWCHKQYASKAKLMQHQRKKHVNLMPQTEQTPRALKNLPPEENIEKNRPVKSEAKTTRVVNYNEVAEEEPVPIALSTNMNHSLSLTASGMNHFQEYEIIATEDDTGGSGILIDTSSIIKRSSFKNDNISSDLLSQAMSEIGVSLSDLRALSSEQYIKMLQSPGGLVMQDPLYTPYTAR